MAITLKKEVKITGNGLMKNKPCEVTLFPSNSGEIRYYIKGQEAFSANVDNVLATDHCVVLGNKKSKAMLTEHLTAALAFCHIDSVDICMSEEEVPILDGSSKSWVEAFKNAGIDKPLLAKDKKYTVSEPVYYLNGKTHCVVLPSDKFRLTYAVNYNHKELSYRWVDFDLKNIEQITEARTFGYLKEVKMLQLMGFARGVNENNAVGMTDDGYTTELRSDFEPVKHKMLDLIGDFYLTGCNPLDWKAEIIVKEAGHTVHYKTAKMLQNKIIKE